MEQNHNTVSINFLLCTHHTILTIYDDKKL